MVDIGPLAVGSVLGKGVSTTERVGAMGIVTGKKTNVIKDGVRDFLPRIFSSYLITMRLLAQDFGHIRIRYMI